MIPSSILGLTVHQKKVAGWYLLSGLVRSTCKVTGLCGLENRTIRYEINKNYYLIIIDFARISRFCHDFQSYLSHMLNIFDLAPVKREQ